MGVASSGVDPKTSMAKSRLTVLIDQRSFETQATTTLLRLARFMGLQLVIGETETLEAFRGRVIKEIHRREVLMHLDLFGEEEAR